MKNKLTKAICALCLLALILCNTGSLLCNHIHYPLNPLCIEEDEYDLQ